MLLIVCHSYVYREDHEEYAIKAFKVEKEGEGVTVTAGISQSACREIAVGWLWQRDDTKGSVDCFL
jgi:hypothetical protein